MQHLQRQVANAMVLYANYKHYHWQTFGPLFRDLHLVFDEFAKAVLDTTDEFAERIRMIGPEVQNVQLRQMQNAATFIPPRPEGTFAKWWKKRRKSACGDQEMREAAKAADESNDPGTVDLFSRMVQIHESMNGSYVRS